MRKIKSELYQAHSTQYRSNKCYQTSSASSSEHFADLSSLALLWQGERNNHMKLSNKTYDTLKWVALIALPALQVFWLTIGKVWNIDYTVEIGATIGAVALFLGALLGVSTDNYRADKIQDTFNTDDIDMIEVAHEDTDNTTEE